MLLIVSAIILALLVIAIALGVSLRKGSRYVVTSHSQRSIKILTM